MAPITVSTGGFIWSTQRSEWNLQCFLNACIKTYCFLGKGQADWLVDAPDVNGHPVRLNDFKCTTFLVTLCFRFLPLLICQSVYLQGLRKISSATEACWNLSVSPFLAHLSQTHPILTTDLFMLHRQLRLIKNCLLRGTSDFNLSLLYLSLLCLSPYHCSSP